MQYLDASAGEDLQYIRQLLLNAGLKITATPVRLAGGSRSYAYAVDELVVRFPKAEIIWQSMRREQQIIRQIQPLLSPDLAAKVHQLELMETEYPFTVSERFAGKICDNRLPSAFAALYQDLSPLQKDNLAAEITAFMRQIHRMDYRRLTIPPAPESIDDWNVAANADFDLEIVSEMLKTASNGKIKLSDFSVAKMNITPALCHNDLSGSNLLINPNENDVLVGIIDFGNVRIMPAYLDFFPLYKINRQLALAVLRHYNAVSDEKIEQNQIDFMALSYIGYGFYRSQNPHNPYLMKLLQGFL